MRRNETIHRQRAGFTLIELLVVIFIIILLIGMLIPAVMKAQIAASNARTKSEIGELGLAVESFKSTYQVPYVPHALILSSSYAPPFPNPTTQDEINANLATADSLAYLGKVWPKAGWTTGAPLPPNTYIQLDGNQCLVFLLGGVPPTDSRFTGGGWQGNRSGFQNVPTNPMNKQVNGVCLAPAPDKAKPPFFDFKIDRVDQNAHFLDRHGTPYYYFSTNAVGNNYGFFGRYRPILNPQNTLGGFTDTGGYGGMEPFRGADGKYLNAESFQIISAGRNKQPGPGGFFEPGVGGYAPSAPGGDDISNFHSGPLGGDD